MKNDLIFGNFIDLKSAIKNYDFDSNYFCCIDIFGKFDLSIGAKANGDVIIFVAFEQFVSPL